MDMADFTWCGWCIADSGRTHATRPCCIARRVAKMMPVARMRAIDGNVELAQLALRWMALRMGRMTKEARQLAYRHAQRAGWSKSDLESLKRMALEEFEKGQADGA